MVHRNDEMAVEDVERLAPSHIIISPGPCTPTEAGISTDVVRRLGPYSILGVCLGHQCIGAVHGGPIVRAPSGARQNLGPRARWDEHLHRPAVAVRPPHSLVIAQPDVPPELRVLATSRDDQEVMAVAHREHPVIGVQFHPESAATEYGYAMLDRFLRGDRARPADVAARADGAPGTPPPVEDEPQTFVPPPVEHVR